MSSIIDTHENDLTRCGSVAAGASFPGSMSANDGNFVSAVIVAAAGVHRHALTCRRAVPNPFAGIFEACLVGVSRYTNGYCPVSGCDRAVPTSDIRGEVGLGGGDSAASRFVHTIEGLFKPGVRRACVLLHLRYFPSSRWCGKDPVTGHHRPPRTRRESARRYTK